MIISPAADELVVITQGDHAHLAAELLSLFRLPELVDHPRRSLLIQATREHDNGWRELDAAPPVDPDSGLPLGFRTVPGASRRSVWSRGCARWREDEPYLALLITLHAMALHREHAGDEVWATWIEELEASCSELLAEVELSAAEAAADHAWLRLADTCSLAVCEQSPRAFGGCGLGGRVEAGALRLDPFPLAGSTTFRLACRTIPRRHYASDRELGRALVAARWQSRSIRVAPS